MRALLESKGIRAGLEAVGDEGKYQFRISLIVAWQYLFRSFFLIYYAFLIQTPIFLCKDPNNPGSFYECTEINGGCVDKILSPNSPSSIVNDLGFYCENSYVRTLGGSLFFVGGNIGVAFFSYLSDHKGRKISMFYSYLFGSISLFLLGTAAVGPFTYVFLLMSIWATLSCYTVLTLTYVAEFSSEKFARNATALLLLSITVGELIIVGVAYLIPSWRTVYIWFIGVPAILTNITFKFFEETPVFLYSQKKLDQTANVLEQVAKVNNKSIASGELGETSGQLDKKLLPEQNQTSNRPVRTWNYLQIMIYPKLTVRVLTFSLIKLYLCMAYFGCIFALSSIGGSIYTNSVIAALAEALGYILSLKAYLFPTRKLVKGSLLIVLFTGVSFAFIPSISCENFFICRPLFIQGFLSLIMRTAICFMYGFIYSLGNELFPPEVRSQSNGISGIFSDIGGIIAPIVLLFAETNQLNPLFLLGVLGFFALIAGQYMPDGVLKSLYDDDEQEDIELKNMKSRNK